MIKKATYQELEQEVQALKRQVASLTQTQISLNEFSKGSRTLSDMGRGGEFDVFRDITWERRIIQSNVMLKISMALPEYPDLEDLLDYIAGEIKQLLDTQGALVILLDEERKEFFFPGAADNDTATQKRVKEIRLPFDSLASAEVVTTGKPLIVNDAYKDSARYARRDNEFGYSFDNYVLVPIKSYDRIIGVLAAFNKSEGIFANPDMALLEMIAGTVGLSIENARFSDELKHSHRELQSLDRAKSKAINHLSHELKTPVSIFSGTLQILEKKLEALPDDSWKRSMDRAQRSLERIKHLQDEARDIILETESKIPPMLTFFLDQCTDLLEDALETETCEIKIIDRVRTRLNGIFKIKNTGPEKIKLDEFVRHRLEKVGLKFIHRGVNIEQALESTPPVFIPADPLQKVIDGLIKNAVENTPDQGKIEVIVSNHASGPRFAVKDYGLGILGDHQAKIFKGFFTTQGTAAYSSKQPFEFNAGGRGADLLRMKIFSEQYNFSIHLSSKRCQFIPGKNDTCPGNIGECSFCKKENDCHQSGGSVFTVDFRI